MSTFLFFYEIEQWDRFPLLQNINFFWSLLDMATEWEPSFCLPYCVKDFYLPEQSPVLLPYGTELKILITSLSKPLLRHWVIYIYVYTVVDPLFSVKRLRGSLLCYCFWKLIQYYTYIFNKARIVKFFVICFHLFKTKLLSKKEIFAASNMDDFLNKNLKHSEKNSLTCHDCRYTE
jgi:hypothetical protein